MHLREQNTSAISTDIYIYIYFTYTYTYIYIFICIYTLRGQVLGRREMYIIEDGSSSLFNVQLFCIWITTNVE